MTFTVTGFTEHRMRSAVGDPAYRGQLGVLAPGGCTSTSAGSSCSCSCGAVGHAPHTAGS